MNNLKSLSGALFICVTKWGRKYINILKISNSLCTVLVIGTLLMCGVANRQMFVLNNIRKSGHKCCRQFATKHYKMPPKPNKLNPTLTIQNLIAPSISPYNTV